MVNKNRGTRSPTADCMQGDHPTAALRNRNPQERWLGHRLDCRFRLRLLDSSHIHTTHKPDLACQSANRCSVTAHIAALSLLIGRTTADGCHANSTQYPICLRQYWQQQSHESGSMLNRTVCSEASACGGCRNMMRAHASARLADGTLVDWRWLQQLQPAWFMTANRQQPLSVEARLCLIGCPFRLSTPGNTQAHQQTHGRWVLSHTSMLSLKLYIWCQADTSLRRHSLVLKGTGNTCFAYCATLENPWPSTAQHSVSGTPPAEESHPRHNTHQALES